jgi:hypothetical protein
MKAILLYFIFHLSSLAIARFESLPILPISVSNTSSWALPNSLACGGSSGGTNYCGDIRARIELTNGDIISNTATVQIYWRRRDPHPELKGVIVTDEAGNGGFTVTSADVTGDCGLITFSNPSLSAGVYYVYYLPFVQSNGGAWLEFHWANCTDQENSEANLCVQGRRRLYNTLAEADMCSTPTSASNLVVGLETRDAFNAFTEMEMMATAAETAAAQAALSTSAPFIGVFPEDARNSVRVFDAGIPVKWALQAINTPSYSPSYSVTTTPGNWLPFQLGLWAYSSTVINMTGVFSDLVTQQGSVISSSLLTILNFGGVGLDGLPFSKNYTLFAGYCGSLWIGVNIPSTASTGLYTGSVTLSAVGIEKAIKIPLQITLSGDPLPFNGFEDPTSMSRLSWLNSARGLEDVVPAPFTAVQAISNGDKTLTIITANKTLLIDQFGMPYSINVNYSRIRLGLPQMISHELLSNAVTFSLIAPSGNNNVISKEMFGTEIVSLSNSSVSWVSIYSVQLPVGSSVNVNVSGIADFTGTVNYVIVVSATDSTATLSDIQLSVPVSSSIAQYIVGGGSQEASKYVDLDWRWSNSTSSNKILVGCAEAGILLNLKGDGDEWDSPMFGADFPIVPFVPTTWGGADALPINNKYGINVTNGTLVAFSGPRTSLQTNPLTFRFALTLTPSKSVNWKAHWATRTQQLGYDIPYASPEDVANRGVTVVTIHQGTPGIINGSLINPWINYPFLDDTVPLLTNYSQQSRDLGMSLKFYYTIRELSARAPEMFAFAALQGEILVDQDPYVIVQPGYGQAWNNHGGSSYLHQHFVTHYGACWQQQESNGEIDPAACTHGVSRLFNYYLEGLVWSFAHAPFVSGIYYDGINFARSSMIRIRRAADSSAAASGFGFPALLDLHTGRDPAPPTCSYASHYPLVDYLWQGEGFSFTSSPSYYLVEISGIVHGLSGDMLGSGQNAIFRGLLFGMTQRDAVSSQAIWRMWDAVKIEEATALFGWWEIDPPFAVSVNVSSPFSSSSSSSSCNFTVTIGEYYGSVNEQCLPPSGPTPGCWSNPTDLTTVKNACCADPNCAGFSFSHAAESGIGCCKTDQTDLTSNPLYDGYKRQGWGPEPEFGCAKSTIFSAYASHAIVIVASWCQGPANVTLTFNWDELGLNPSTSIASLPTIEGVQTPSTLSSANGPFTVTPTGGFVMLIQAA